VVSGYAVAFGGLLLLGGRACDRVGPRRIFTAGLLAYGVASLAGGLAATPATGQPWHLPAAAAEQSLSFAPTMLTDDYQGEGKMFAEPVAVPQDAPPLDRLLGLSGRHPDWIAT